MLKFFADFLPILLFFVVYKTSGIYAATTVAIIASLLQVAWQGIRYRRVEMMQLLTLLIIVVFGGATLYLHNELFIKWKPTAINWVMAAIFGGSSLFSKKPLVQTLMPDNLKLAPQRWQYLNLSWVVFFLISGAANLYVVYHYDTNTWVNFKLFGMLGLTLVFVALQAIYLMRYLPHDAK